MITMITAICFILLLLLGCLAIAFCLSTLESEDFGRLRFRNLLSTDLCVVGIAYVMFGFEATIHSHPVSEVYFYLWGAGHLFLDGKISYITSPALIWIPAGSKHAFTPTTDVSWLLFGERPESLSPLEENRFSLPPPPPPPPLEENLFCGLSSPPPPPPRPPPSPPTPLPRLQSSALAHSPPSSTDTRRSR